MKQFILEEHMDIIVSESGEIDEVMHLELCYACIKLIRVGNGV